MKKLILFFSVLFLSGMVAFGQPTTTLSLPDMGGGISPGLVTTPLTVEAIGGGDNFGTFQIFIVYDPLVVTPVAVNFTNPMLPFYEWQNNLAYGPDEIILTWLSFAGGYIPSPGEELCTIEWDYTGDPNYTSLTFNTVGDQIPGWEEKGQTLVWTTFGTEYVTTLIDGSIGPADLSYVWNGSFNSNWNEPLNWTPNGIPTATDNATIPAGMPNELVLEANVDIENFTVQTGATFTNPGFIFTSTGLVTIEFGALWIQDGGDPLNNFNNQGETIIGEFGWITTTGEFVNDGILTIQAGPNPGYAGSFIDYGTMSGTGTFNFFREMFCTGITAMSADPFGWHYLAAPIDGFTSDDMFDYYVNDWEEQDGSWTKFEMPYPPNPPCTPWPTEPLNALDAWSINYALDYECGAINPPTGLDLEFSGDMDDVHTGPYSAPATYTGAAPYPGWNMFGNPYPSGLDMDLILWDPAAIPGAAYYDGCAGNYVYWTPALGSYVMAPGLGFFTEFTAPGTFSLAGTERAVESDWFWKAEGSDLLTLEITGNDKSDITHIRFMEEASTGFAKDGDFHKLFSTEIPQIYTTADADKLAINALPETENVPMGMTSTISGSYTISAIETSDFDCVILEDLVTGIQTDLLEDSYAFEYTTGDDEDRFIVHFVPVGISDNFADMVNIWSSANNIYVQVPDVTGDIVVFNMMGQEVVRTGIETGTTVIPMSNVNTYYVVKVLTSDNAVTGKVFIK